MCSEGLKTVWQEVREATGLLHFRMYDLRHTTITRMAEAGVPLAVIMSMAGHVSPRMTQYYTHISEQKKTDAMRDVQRLLVETPLSHKQLLLYRRRLALTRDAVRQSPLRPPIQYLDRPLPGAATGPAFPKSSHHKEMTMQAYPIDRTAPMNEAVGTWFRQHISTIRPNTIRSYQAHQKTAHCVLWTPAALATWNLRTPTALSAEPCGPVAGGNLQSALNW
jgi:hypothetical protein